MKESIDMIFLDINMPHLSGIEFLKAKENPPKVIITTAYPEYALESYDLDVLDYLLKPISFERFFKASNKARQYFELLLKNTASGESKYFFLKCNKRLEKIHFADILFIESMQNYVWIHTIHDKLLCHSTLKNIKAQLPEHLFVQTHKSFIASIKRVKAIEGNQLVINDHKIPISKYLKEEVLKKITRL